MWIGVVAKSPPSWRSVYKFEREEEEEEVNPLILKSSSRNCRPDLGYFGQ